MKQVVIENPILNSPFEEPRRHFRFTEEGITDEIVEARRSSGYFVPVPQPRKKGKQLALATEWTQDRFKESEFINRVRDRVEAWREQSPAWPGVTATTKRLLEHWTNPERERRLFFCQIEAVETAIYLTEVAGKRADAWIANTLVEANAAFNPGLFRIAFKMATGSGKTVLMGMLIAWQALNKLASPQDARFSDAFLLVAPGITIRDRLRVLLPSDPESYYKKLDLLPVELAERLGQAKIVITNFHAFLPREKIKAGRLTKQILRGSRSTFAESPGEVVRRVCRELGGKRNLVVINDEAHHCYRPKPATEEAGEKLSGEERREAKEREEEARVWISGLEAVQAKLGLRAIYDLSATPFFLKGSGYPEGTLFPWVVSDFSLIDAIEAGIVKIPRVPVDDDAQVGDAPTYRNLWLRIRDHLPRKGRTTEEAAGPPVLPAELEGALQSLYANYRKAYERWESNTQAQAAGLTPPVFIVVANNTNVSKLLFDHIAGYEKKGSDGEALIGPGGQPILVPGALPIFSNVEAGRWTARPNTILVDSRELESAGGMSPDFKKIAAQEIDEWKAAYRERFPGRDPEQLGEEDLLREVLNTVGKAGKLGEGVRCVVSVAMLTEGWDANTVTHVLGVRAFGTQLLCEQVVGRGLRRTSYALSPKGRFTPEYAEVYGVPFSFIPTSGSTGEPKPGLTPTRVRALPERAHLEITFPRVVGYRWEAGEQALTVSFSEESRLALSTADVPSWTESAPIVGESEVHRLAELEARRPQEVAFLLAKLVCERYFPAQPWRFPELLRTTRDWLATHLTLKDNVFPQYLLLVELAHRAAEKIYRAISVGTSGSAEVRPILAPYDAVGSTRYVEFDTTREVWPTREDKSHLSHVVLDSKDWEAKAAQALEEMDEVVSYAKNHNLGFTIPYAIDGEERRYLPDYLVRVDDGHGPGDLLNLIVEVTGEKDEAKSAKVDTATNLWVPAVNAKGAFGRWAFYEIRDPWSTKKEIRESLAVSQGDASP